MIDPGLQAELNARYNPDGSELREMQLKMLELLKYVDSICRKHDIPYWLSAGTLLGAVRHGGFIPWDDDIDIELRLSDYLRLAEILRKECDGRYVFHDHKADSAYIQPFGKLRLQGSYIKERLPIDLDYRYHGIYIDIFPMVPSNSLVIHQIGKGLFLCCYAGNVLIKNKMLRKVYRGIAYFIAFRLIAPPLRFLSSLGAKGKLREPFGGVLHQVRYENEIFPLKTMLFEDCECLVPADTDAYLKRMYGDYMTLPKEIIPHLAKGE